MSENQDLNSLDGIKAWLTNQLASRLELDARDIDTGERFSRYGLKSAVATSMVTDLSKALGRKLMPTLVWDHPTIEKLAHHLTAGAAPAAESNGAGEENVSVGPGRPVAANEPIAVVGMACRFPQAPNLEKYWELLKNGVDAISEVPVDRWSLDEYFSEDTTEPGKMSTRWGGFLDQVDQFDPFFFSISPREAIQMDPNQRLVMELCWEALEDAGVNIPSLVDSLTGVYMGNIWNDYGTLAHRGNTDYIQQHTSTGSHYSIIANRVSYTLGLQGPSMTVDTACSSSLVSVHLACQALRNGEATMALAGGVNLIIAPDSTVNMSKFGAMAPDGRSKAFDHRANGYVRGEGAGVIVLKTLSQALADGDPINCVIRGSAVNNDGPSNGLTAPNPASQQNVLRAAYKSANVPTDRVHYVECHGTGTMLGDPIEAGALGAVLGAGRSKEKPLIIGSVKTNFGHLEGAAGIAGLIKLVLAIQNRAIPASLHFQKPNPHIPFEDINVKVNNAYQPWPYDDNIVAGVSSFGFGGTNCHVVLEEFARSSMQLLPLSADKPEALRELATEMRGAIADEMKKAEESDPEERRDIPAAEICFAAGRGLAGRKHRLAVVGGTKKELSQQLAAFLEDRQKPGIAIGEASVQKPKVVFFCPGQGGQWLGMGRELMRSQPIFRATLEQCDQAIHDTVGWSLLDELNAEESYSRITGNPQVDVIQPAIWAMQVAQAALWKSWGVVPDVVIGHSMGEVAAAYIAGNLSMEDAAKVICLRSKLAKKASGKGGMAVVALDAEKSEEIAATTGGLVSVASCNSPNTTVLAGDSDELKKIFEQLEKEEIFCRLVNVDFASHSSQMDPLLDELFNLLRGVKPRQGTTPLFSTVNAGYIDGTEMNASYWVRNLRETVQFAQSLEKLLDDGANAFVEMSPHPVLAAAVEQTVVFHQRTAIVLPSTRRDEDERGVMLESLGQLFTYGCDVNWRELYSDSRGTYELPEAAVKAARGTVAAVEQEKTNGDLFLVSARNEQALRSYAANMADFIRNHEGASLPDLAYTTSLKRYHHEHRLGVIAQTRDELIKTLEAFAGGETDDPGFVAGRTDPKHNRKLAFIFTGQGAQWFAMGRELMQSEPVFRNRVQEIDEILQRYAEWSIMEELAKSEGDSRVMETQFAQPMIFAVQVGLAALWKHWSIEPGAVLGHSVGEVAAAQVAGLLSLEDATMLIYHRGRFMQEATGLGKMCHVGKTAAEVEPYLEGFEDRLAIAAYNSPSAVVISGETAALESVLEKLQKDNVFCKMLPVDYAFHSPQMEPFKTKLARAVSNIVPLESSIPMYSTVKAKAVASWEVEASYWGENIRGAVRFAPAMAELIEAGFTNFIEIGAHPALAGYLNECLEDAHREGTVVHSLQRKKSERSTMLRSLATLYTRGYPVDWRHMYRQGGRFVKLPAYPWQRQRVWMDKLDEMKPSQVRVGGGAALSAPGDHIFLGHRHRSSLAAHKDVIQFEAIWDDQTPYMLKDHILFDMVVVPGAAHMALILLGAKTALGTDSLAVLNSEFMQALVLPEGEPRHVQLSLTPESDGTYALQTASLAVDGSEDDWIIHAIGKVATHDDSAPADKLSPEKIDEIKGRATKEYTQESYYDNFRECGYDIGPATFQWVNQAWRRDSETLAFMKKPFGVTDVEDYLIFPGFHDALYHAVTSCFPHGLEHYVDSNTIYVPWGNTEAKVYGEFKDEMWLHIECRDTVDSVNDKQEVFQGDLTLYDMDGNVVYAIKGWVLKRVSSSALLRSLKKKLAPWTYAAEWREEKAPAAGKVKGRFAVFSDQGGTGDKLVAALKSSGQDAFAVKRGEAFAKDGDGYKIGPTAADDYKELFKAEKDLKGVLHLWSLDAVDATKLDADELESAVLDELDQGLAVIRGLASSGTPPRLYMVTRETTPAGDSKSFRLTESSLWGLGRVAAVELAEAKVTMVDLGAESDADEQVKALVTEISADDKELEVAYRGADRYVSRLKRIPPGEDADLELTQDGAYLITGGLGGLGLRIADWLQVHGARNLVLTGRSEPKEEAQEAIAEMEKHGVKVQIARGDVSDGADVKRIMSEIKVPLKGVIHAAGVLDDGTILTMNRERMQKVVRAKVAGAWNLHRATEDKELDFFLFYSSVAGLIGSPGQSNYASGNVFLDALAHHRRAKGLTAQSVDWGPWKEVGMAAALDKRRANRGYPKVGMIDVNKGMDLMGSLLKQDLTQAAVLAFDWVKYVEEFPVNAGVPMLSDLVTIEQKQAAAAQEAATTAPAAGGSSNGSDAPVVAEMRSAPAKERKDKLQEFVAGQVAKILGLSAGASIDAKTGFMALGMDSLMTVEFRNRLKNSLQVTLGNTVTFDYPTTEALTEYLYEDVLELSGGEAEAGPSADENAAAELAAAEEAMEGSVNEMSDEEAEAELLRELGG